MRKYLRHLIPQPEVLALHQGLRWIAPLLRDPGYWHFDRRRVALGLGIGVFFAIVTPVAQMLLAALAAIRLRANVPIAVVGTFASNPLTSVPLILAEWQIGAALLGSVEPPPALGPLLREQTWWPLSAAWASGVELVTALGKPVLVGMPILAAAAGLLTWLLVRLLWRWQVQWRWRTRRRGGVAG